MLFSKVLNCESFEPFNVLAHVANPNKRKKIITRSMIKSFPAFFKVKKSTPKEGKELCKITIISKIIKNIINIVK